MPDDTAFVREASTVLNLAALRLQPERCTNFRVPQAQRRWINTPKVTATTPNARRQRQPGTDLPLGGAVASVAPVCANVGRFLRVNGRKVRAKCARQRSVAHFRPAVPYGEDVFAIS